MICNRLVFLWGQTCLSDLHSLPASQLNHVLFYGALQKVKKQFHFLSTLEPQSVKPVLENWLGFKCISLGYLIGKRLTCRRCTPSFELKVRKWICNLFRRRSSTKKVCSQSYYLVIWNAEARTLRCRPVSSRRITGLKSLESPAYSSSNNRYGDIYRLILLKVIPFLPLSCGRAEEVYDIVNRRLFEAASSKRKKYIFMTHKHDCFQYGRVVTWRRCHSLSVDIRDCLWKMWQLTQFSVLFWKTVWVSEFTSVTPLNEIFPYGEFDYKIDNTVIWYKQVSLPLRPKWH